jgi:hypothetical protein
LRAAGRSYRALVFTPALGHPVADGGAVTAWTPSAVALPGGQILLMAFDPATGQARQAHFVGSGWVPWQPVIIPITTQSLTACRLYGPDRAPLGLYTIDEGAMCGLEHRQGRWRTWASLHGRHTSKPAALSLPYGETGNSFVFSRGVNHELWWKGWSGQDRAWSDWWSLKGDHRSAPAVVGWTEYPGAAEARAVMLLFTVGADRRIWYREYSNDARRLPYKENGWCGDWRQLGPDLAASDPAAALRDENRFDVFVAGEGGTMLHRRWEYGTWSPTDRWDTVDGQPAASAPTAVWRNTRTLDLFYRGPLGELLWRTWRSDGGWNIAIPESCWPTLT